jgi:hypothetical protein
MAEKTPHQIKCESGFYGPIGLRYKNVKVVKESPQSPLKVGDVVTVVRWGTFGAWDENNNWVDFYCIETE